MTSWSVTEPRQILLDDAGPITRLDVRLIAGRLTVVGTDGPPRVEIARASETPIDVDLSGGTLTVGHSDPSPWPGILGPLWWFRFSNRKFDSDVSIAVPYETAATLWMASGAVIASSLYAGLRVDCVNGRITLLGIDGAIGAKVISGPIEALGCSGDIELETVSGEITLADSAASRVRAKTVSGALTADLDNPPDGAQITLETISGEITIRVREDSDLRVSLAAAHGRVTSDFPGLTVPTGWGATATGTIGSGTGTGRLEASAVGGNISLLRRPYDADFAGRDDDKAAS